jgi:hypothetical protein
MRYLMMAGASALALASGPALAQDAGGKHGAETAGSFPCPHYNLEESGLRSSDIKEAMRRDEDTARDVRRDRDGPARDAMGNPPVQPGASAEADGSPSRDVTSFGELAERLPVPDVSDRAVETRQDGQGEDADSASDGTTDRPARGSATASTRDFSDIIDEGDVVPEGIRDWQDKEKWKLGAQDGQKTPREIRREARQRAERDSGDRTLSTRTGSDRTTAGSDDRRPSAGQSSSSDSADATREQRRRALAAIALLSARQAVPSARFGTYAFTMDDNERVIEISGRDRRSGERVAVDVYPDGAIQSIDTAIALDDVPESVRSTVRGKLGRLRVAHTTRSLRRDLDIYYEFAGIAESGRAVEVRIRADGADLSVRYLDRS